MAENRPLVSILMAVYRPNRDWLIEQLNSLNRQTYPNLELIVYDDCPEEPTEERFFSECIKEFPYRIIRGEKNIGSTKAFERLTVEGNGTYFSYCDQDDIWHDDKIERLVDVMEKEGAMLACSDLGIIDENGVRFADSMTQIRKRHIFLEGEGLASVFMFRNFALGCALVIRSEIAKASVPFVDSLIHDQWLALNASLRGRISVVREPLIEYRQHRNNQTAILKGVTTKQDYFVERIQNMQNRIDDYKARLNGFPEIQGIINDLDTFNCARIRYFYHHKRADLKIMRQYASISKEAVLIETVMPFIPNFLMKFLFGLIQRGKV